MSNSFNSKIKISHNTLLYRTCIIGYGLAGKALTFLLSKHPKFIKNTCILEVGPQHNHTKQFYTSTGFIQHKSLKLIKKFFTPKPPILQNIDNFNLIYNNRVKQIALSTPLGYMLDLDSFLQQLNNPAMQQADHFYDSHILSIKRVNNYGHNSFLLKMVNGTENKLIRVKQLVIADGATSNTSQILRKAGLKININRKFSQGAEAIVRISTTRYKAIAKELSGNIYFGIYPEFYGYGMWIAPFKDNLLKIGYAIDQKIIIKRQININQRLELAIKIAGNILKIPANDMKIIHKGFKLIPLVTATQLYNITPYKGLWQIGDAGGFVGPLLLDGIYPGLNSVIDTYHEIIGKSKDSNKNIKHKHNQTMIWQPKISIPGNSIYTHKLLSYITKSAILKELYNGIFVARPITNLSVQLASTLLQPILKLLLHIKQETQAQKNIIPNNMHK